MNITANPNDTFSLNCTAKEMDHIRFVLKQYHALQTKLHYPYSAQISRNLDDIGRSEALLATLSPVCADSLDLINA